MIEVKHVCKAFKQFRAVWDLSFNIQQGDIFGFVGPNGSGKTTTMRMMATLLDPDYGDIVIDGVSVLDEPEICLLYTSPSPRDRTRSRMPSSA